MIKNSIYPFQICLYVFEIEKLGFDGIRMKKDEDLKYFNHILLKFNVLYIARMFFVLCNSGSNIVANFESHTNNVNGSYLNLHYFLRFLPNIL